MAITDGEPVNAAASNAAWLSKKQDDTTIGKLGLNNADIGSGAPVTNTQKAINKTFETSGIVDENDTANNTYSSHEVITDGDDRKVAIGKLDAQVDANLQNVTQNTSDISDNAADIATNAADIATIDSEVVKVTGDQTIAGIKTFSDDVVINGDLEVNGTTTTVNSATLDVADANITINDGGSDASSEGSGLTVERVGTDGSIVYENALDNRFKIGDDGSEEEIYAVVKDTKANLDAIVTKSTSRIYVATDEDDATYRYNSSSGDLEPMGGSGGSGTGSSAIYELLNAENDALVDWTNTGGGTFSYETTTPLNGVQSYKFEPSAATDKITSKIIDVPLRSREGGNVNQIDFAYSASDSGFKVNVLGVTSSTTIASFDIDNTENKSRIQFLLPETEEQIRFEVECDSFTALMEIVFDDVEFNDRPYFVTGDQIAFLRRVESSGVDGGTFSSGSWITRQLNSVEGTFVSLSSDQFTLQPGEYKIDAQAQCFQVGANKLKLRNITDSSDDLVGMSETAPTGSSGSTTNLRGTINLLSAKTFELQHRGTASKTTTGLGLASSFGVDEIYVSIEITKIT